MSRSAFKTAKGIAINQTVAAAVRLTQPAFFAFVSILVSLLDNKLKSIMGWFGSSSDSEPAAPAETSFTSDDAGFAPSGTDMSSSSLGGGGAAGASQMQQFAMQVQQQMMVQTVINSLTDQAFEKCITGRPGDSLGGKEAACIHSTVNKWMDTNEFMMGRMAKKQQAQAGQQTFG